MKRIISLIRRLFKKNCPICGGILVNHTTVEYVPAYGEDPPYGGTYEVKTLTCYWCPVKIKKERHLSVY